MNNMTQEAAQNDAPAAQAEALELGDFATRVPTGAPLLSTRADLFDSVKVQLSVVVGQAESTVGELMALQALSVLKIDRGIDCPVDVVVNGNIIARGQLVAVDDHFGVRITEVAKGVQG
jgi:flagellar motor switch protein FliN/FliY